MKIKDLEVKIVREDIVRVAAEAVVESVREGPLKRGETVAVKAQGVKGRAVIRAGTQGITLPADETLLRQVTAGILKCADALEVISLAVPALAAGADDSLIVGMAKIMTQEVMKYARRSNVRLREVIFCLPDQKIFEIFNREAGGYIRHFQALAGATPYITVDIIIECSAEILKRWGGEFPEPDEPKPQGGIVLIERSNPPYGWALPGGFVDYGESLEEAAAREAREETNLEVVDLRQFHTYSAPQRDPRFHTISTVFIGEGRGEPKAGDDAKHLKIVRYEDLPEVRYAFDHKEIIEEYLVEKDFD